jgi:hypothetical protein
MGGRPRGTARQRRGSELQEGPGRVLSWECDAPPAPHAPAPPPLSSSSTSSPLSLALSIRPPAPFRSTFRRRALESKDGASPSWSPAGRSDAATRPSDGIATRAQRADAPRSIPHCRPFDGVHPPSLRPFCTSTAAMDAPSDSTSRTCAHVVCGSSRRSASTARWLTSDRSSRVCSTADRSPLVRSHQSLTEPARARRRGQSRRLPEEKVPVQGRLYLHPRLQG